MLTQCSAKGDLFAPVEERAVVAEFDGGAITSDAERMAMVIGSWT
jgi:hypothetical protein